MIRTVIIEDEPIIADYLVSYLTEVDPRVQVVARLESVRESVEYFSDVKNVDLIFSDVQLRDGLSFSIFETVDVPAPVVFVTAFDAYVLKALEKNGIEYLLKPVSKEDLSRALNKYKSLHRHFTGQLASETLQDIQSNVTRKARTRILAKKGVEHLPLLLSEIVFFYTENRVVLAADSTGRKFMVDKTLSELEEELDPRQFFRANRQYLLNIDYIKSYKPYERVKLWVELTVNNIEYSIVISQVTASVFRRWLEKS